MGVQFVLGRKQSSQAFTRIAFRQLDTNYDITSTLYFKRSYVQKLGDLAGLTLYPQNRSCTALHIKVRRRWRLQPSLNRTRSSRESCDDQRKEFEIGDSNAAMVSVRN